MKKVLFFLSLFTITFCLKAQIHAGISAQSTMTISGTSTIHDWTSKVNTINGDLTFSKIAGQKSLPDAGKLVENLKMEVPVKSIESPRGVVMDNKTYEALKSEEFPLITFILRDDHITGVSDKAAGKFTLAITGDLTIAGTTKTVSLNLNGSKIGNGTFQFDGSYSINMTEYNVTPPTAMFGQIVTGENVTLAFSIKTEESR